MTRPLRNLISAVTLAALTGLLVLAATQWTDVFFRFYPAFSRWILGVLAGVTKMCIRDSHGAGPYPRFRAEGMACRKARILT